MRRQFTIATTLLFITCTSWYCTSYKSELTNTDCLDNYQYCDSIYLFDETYNDLSANLLFARWQIRKENYIEGNKVLDSLQTILNNKREHGLYNQVVLYKFISELALNQINIDSIESQINQTKDLVHKSNMLFIKSIALRYIQETNYSFTTGLYGEYLRSNLQKKIQNNLYYLPYYTHNINLLKEDVEKNYDKAISKYYLIKTLVHCESRSPKYSWIKTLLEGLKENLSEAEIKEIKSKVILKNQYSPFYHNLINLHLNYVAGDDHFAIKNLISDVDKTKPNHEPPNLYNVLYLIDAFLATNNFQEAEKWFNLISADPENEVHKNYITLRKQSLLNARYTRTDKLMDLDNLYETSIQLLNSYFNHGKNIVNEHFAETIYNSNNIFLEAIFELYRKNKLPESELLNHLNDIKSLYNKISDSRSVLGNKKPNDEELQKINYLKHEIEKRELAVGRYRDTNYHDLSVFEDLYFLHKELYDLKQTLPEITEEEAMFNDQKLSLPDIDQQTQIIDFIQSDSSLFLTRITSDDIKLIKLDKQKTLAAIKEKINGSKNLAYNFEQDYLDNLFSDFLSPDHPHISFIPDGKFFEFPIELIQSKDGSYLVDHYTISYASQISEAINQETELLDDELFTASYSSSETLKKGGEKSVPELMFGLNEVMSINELYTNSSSYSGFEFTEEKIQSALDKDIVHISSHSSSSTKNPLDNYILVRDDDGKEQPVYGFSLKVMDWDCKLVILSSCESGTGTLKPGAGIFSLSRDFLQSGAETVIKSLWKVNDQSTSKLMLHFHQNLKSGMTASQALQNAKLSMKAQEEYTHPYYWAGFILEGNPNLKFNPDSISF